MKLIEAMKKAKDLQRKKDDLKKKVATYCADYDFETPAYGGPAEQFEIVRGWIQAHSDILKEVLGLRVAIQKTNLVTPVTIVLGDQQVTKTIAEWIHRRRDLASSELEIWTALGDKGLKEGRKTTTTGAVEEVKVRRYFNPSERDRKIDLFRSEPLVIDSTLEVVNAVTDLVE